MSKSKVLFIMTGSIACYKACHVISRLVQAGVEVQVVASPSALRFVGAATLEGLSGRPVVSDMYQSGNVMDHIHLMRWADLIIAAPATASFINKASQGTGDDLIQTMFLAHDFSRPFLIAPAMNKSMYTHPVTKKSLEQLKDMGLQILDSASGILACGEEGWGRLLEPDLILQHIFENLKTPSTSPTKKDTKAQPTLKILVTAGGTKEAIDTVRSITNTSTGNTGISIAENLSHLGADVFLLQAEGSRKSFEVAKTETFTDFKDLQQKVKSSLENDSFDYVIHTAAVSDYSLEQIIIQGKAYTPHEINKVSSETESINLKLKRNPKIVNSLKSYSKNPSLKVIAFKLTSSASKEEQDLAVEKLFKNANADFVVHNDLTEIDSINKTHRFTLINPTLKTSCNSLDELNSALAQVLMKRDLP